MEAKIGRRMASLRSLFGCGFAALCINEQLLDVEKVRHVFAVKHTIASVIDRLVERMGADPNRGSTEIVFADVHRIEGHVPGVTPFRQDVRFLDRVFEADVNGNTCMGTNVPGAKLDDNGAVCGWGPD